jgi:hypothetical protein
MSAHVVYRISILTYHRFLSFEPDAEQKCEKLLADAAQMDPTDPEARS